MPTVLAGRDPQLHRIRDRLGHVATFQHSAGPPMLFSAPRGIGKTVLLRTSQREASHNGFVCAWISARSDANLVSDISAALGTGLQSAGTTAGQRLRDRLDSVSLEVGIPGAKVGATFDVGSRPAQDLALETILREAARLASGEGLAGVALIVDELHEAANADLKTFAYAAQHLEGEADSPPVAIFGAGLPSLAETIMEAATFAERFEYANLDRLSPADTHTALAAPAQPAGVTWTRDAIDLAINHTAGYPYMIQLQGYATWEAAQLTGPGTLTVDHARTAATDAVERMAAMFRGRWAKATTRERHFLAAMASSGDGPVERAQIATALDQPTGALGMPRASLIDKGLIAPAGRGLLEFTAPGFAEFIRQQAEEGKF